MTRIQERDQIRKDFTVANGIIRTPGRFEGAAEYVPAFWDIVLDGCADEEDEGVASIPVEPEDIEAWPVLAGRTSVRLVQDDNGFIFEV